ncbi:MAG: RnfABCDGE type electron transport complex subunit B [Gammaproteobacteria bacterium]|nr:RnfABCDGE type electron transport complex subunit B [Gammaproteobacteria bacterium]MCP5423921.1 RnfABCDGE type electron transport complex subunit B [Gammaproteobacteria bacterium]MCP5459400.1 RnfABCDGE type electron transport complex subunit B [Gammaproteobacteria bacterium]
MFAAVSSLTILGLTLGFLLGVAARYLKVETNPLTAEIESFLSGANCGQCGYPGCGPAAEALAKGEAPVTLCPPGGKALVEKLAAKLGVSVDVGDMEDTGPRVAFVNEALCIGCAHCIKECNLDAIMGAPKHIHTVLNEVCNGCGECVKVCPTECLQLQPIPTDVNTWVWSKPAVATA